MRCGSAQLQETRLRPFLPPCVWPWDKGATTATKTKHFHSFWSCRCIRITVPLPCRAWGFGIIWSHALGLVLEAALDLVVFRGICIHFRQADERFPLLSIKVYQSDSGSEWNENQNVIVNQLWQKAWS